MLQSRDPITLVGGGLVGSLLATQLGKLGFSIEVYEKRSDPRQSGVSEGRSINLAISVRGLYALESIGIRDEVLRQAIPMRGRFIHTAHGETHFQPYGKNPDECIHSLSRGVLNQILISHAEATGRVAFHFGKRVEKVDLFKHELSLEKDEVRTYRRLIGTDGSASCIRKAMMQLPGYEESESLLEHGYKELILPSGPNESFLLEKNALHIWPRETFMLIALPNLGGSFTCTLFLPLRGPVSFETLDTPGRVETFFNQYFPDAVRRFTNLTDDFFGHPTGTMVTVRCSPWHYKDEVLLLGDAAHAIVPFFGQGMNCGFEDITVLNAQLGAGAGTDWSKVFYEFSRNRKINSDAIAAMALENFIEMRDKVAQPQFQLERAIERLIEKEFPGYHSRYRLVTFHRVPYEFAYRVGNVENEVLEELSQGLKDPNAFDRAKASRLISQKLDPLYKEIQ